MTRPARKTHAACGAGPQGPRKPGLSHGPEPFEKIVGFHIRNGRLTRGVSLPFRFLCPEFPGAPRSSGAVPIGLSDSCGLLLRYPVFFLCLKAAKNACYFILVRV